MGGQSLRHQARSGPVTEQVNQTVSAFTCGAKVLAVEQADKGCTHTPIYHLWSLAQMQVLCGLGLDHRWEISS
jgi:hypothetical protein